VAWGAKSRQDRDFAGCSRVFRVRLHRGGRSVPVFVTKVVTAPGVDTLAERWAEQHGIPVMRFPADWKRYGRRVGSIRNQKMAEYAEALVAVWDGRSRGNLNMIR
jgi:hypothetical protein